MDFAVQHFVRIENLKILAKINQIIIFFFSVRRMPIDIKTSVGYGLALATELIGMLAIGSVLCLVNTFFFGVCWYIEACLSDLESIFLNINVALSKQYPQKVGVHQVTRSHLTEFIKFHLRIIS